MTSYSYFNSTTRKVNTDNVKITYDEHYGAEQIFYKNQRDLEDGKILEDGTVVDKNGNEIEPEPVNTGNIQVHGGIFRCGYDSTNMAKLEKTDRGYDDDGEYEHFRMFPGTFGSVNLGVNSFGADLIRDGRIQLVDSADGCLVLLDDQEDGTNGLFHYRLFCGDTELRTKSYLKVYPNEAMNNSSFSMQLCYYNGSGKQTNELYKDDGEDNIRSPYRQMENYFDFQIDDKVSRTAYSVMPNFHKTATNANGNNQLLWDVYGEKTATSEVWYYPAPLDKKGLPIDDVPYGNACAYFFDNTQSKTTYRGMGFGDVVTYSNPARGSDTWKNVQINNYGRKILLDRDVCRDEDWYNILKDSENFPESAVFLENYKGIRTNMKYFTYKVYQVDPLTRENINASRRYGGDEPLLTVRYGCAPEESALKCKLPLDEVEQRIKDAHPEWQGYRAGEMYRIVLEVEERIGAGEKQLDGCVGLWRKFNDFGQKLSPAKTTTSILFRCYEQTEQYHVKDKDGNTAYVEKYLGTDFTPVQWP